MRPITHQSGKKSTRVRFGILALIFVSVVINYMDRSNISIAAPLLSHELHLTPEQMGLVFSAFGWAYAFLQIPGGWLLDRMGPRILYALILGMWSILTLVQGFVRGFATLFGFRLALGAMEAPAYPANNRIVTSWFPDHERATAIGTYTSGQFVGLAFLTPILVAIQDGFGWRGLFVITGLIGIIWSMVWYFLYRDPENSRRISETEIQYIRQGGGLVNEHQKEQNEKKRVTWSDLKFVLSQRKLWGVYIGQFCLTSTLWFFLTWFPTYLVEYRHMAFIKAGFLGSLPFLAAFVGVLLSGFLSDFLVRRGFSPGTARKTPIILGLLLSVSIIGANYVETPGLIIFFLTMAFFGNGLASIAWVFVSVLAPSEILGLTGGVFNFFGNLSSIFVPLIIGFLVKGGNFAPALVFIGVLALVGALSYILFVGKVERLELPGEKTAKP